jgi:hypothetical protein
MSRIEVEPVEEGPSTGVRLYMSREDVGRIDMLIERLNSVLSVYPDTMKTDAVLERMHSVLLAINERDQKRFERLLDDLNRIVTLLQKQAESPELMEKVVTSLEVVAAAVDKNIYAELRRLENAIVANSEATLLKMDDISSMIDKKKDTEQITLIRDVEAVNENLNRLISQLKQTDRTDVSKELKSINRQLAVLYDFEHMLKIVTEKKLAVSRIKPKNLPPWAVANLDRIADEVQDVVNKLVDIMIVKELSRVESATATQIADAINHNYRHTKSRLEHLVSKNRVKTGKKGRNTIYFL